MEPISWGLSPRLPVSDERTKLSGGISLTPRGFGDAKCWPYEVCKKEKGDYNIKLREVRMTEQGDASPAPPTSKY